jgi:hypothetical protein
VGRQSRRQADPPPGERNRLLQRRSLTRAQRSLERHPHVGCAVTILRVSRGGTASVSGAPHAPQKRNPSTPSAPQRSQTTIASPTAQATADIDRDAKSWTCPTLIVTRRRARHRPAATRVLVSGRSHTRARQDPRSLPRRAVASGGSHRLSTDFAEDRKCPGPGSRAPGPGLPGQLAPTPPAKRRQRTGRAESVGRQPAR